jgi:hypothetical protein
MVAVQADQVKHVVAIAGVTTFLKGCGTCRCVHLVPGASWRPISPPPRPRLVVLW